MMGDDAKLTTKKKKVFFHGEGILSHLGDFEGWMMGDDEG